MHFETKDQLHSLNILQVIDSEKCGYLNARKLLFQNNFRDSACSQIRKTDEICTAALLSYFFINPWQME